MSSQLFGEPDADEDVSPDTETAAAAATDNGSPEGKQEKEDEEEGRGVPMDDTPSDGLKGKFSWKYIYPLVFERI